MLTDDDSGALLQPTSKKHLAEQPIRLNRRDPRTFKEEDLAAQIKFPRRPRQAHDWPQRPADEFTLRDTGDERFNVRVIGVRQDIEWLSLHQGASECRTGVVAHPIELRKVRAPEGGAVKRLPEDDVRIGDVREAEERLGRALREIVGAWIKEQAVVVPEPEERAKDER